MTEIREPSRLSFDASALTNAHIADELLMRPTLKRSAINNLIQRSPVLDNYSLEQTRRFAAIKKVPISEMIEIMVADYVSRNDSVAIVEDTNPNMTS